jgi:hypothetical protein
MKKNFNPVKNQNLAKVISWMLIISILNLSVGCIHYFKVTDAQGPVDENLIDLKNQKKVFILHSGEETWPLYNLDVSQDSLNGRMYNNYISFLDKPVKKRSNRYNPYKQSHILYEVHLHSSDIDRSNYPNISIPLSSIQKVELYEKDKAATNISWVLGFLGGIWAALAAISFYYLNNKTTFCPVVYVYDGEDYHLAGEIYSGSMHPGLERHDFLKLPGIHERGVCQLLIANEIKEVQHTNLMELWVFDHADDTGVFVDKHGKYHTVSGIVPPVKAVNFSGIDVTDLVIERDHLFYSSNEISSEMPLTDGLVLEFDIPHTADTVKLILRAKNSYILDNMMAQYFDLYGNRYSKWQKQQNKAPGEQLYDWTLQQNIPLSLHMERNGAWEMVDYFHTAGPMAMKDDIIAIPLNGTEPNPLRIKLEYGNFFWEIDYAGIDYSPNLELNYSVVSVETAINQNGKDISYKLLLDDDKYFVQPEIGDHALVTFRLPEPATHGRTIFLHSKGWYEVLRSPAGKPDHEYIENFKQPGYFNQFVNERVFLLANGIAINE